MNTLNTYRKGKAVRLSANFKSTEFDCQGRGCCSTTPVSPALVSVLQIVRDHFGRIVHINCGYRCRKHNAEVRGASKTSRHMEGLAADIKVKDVHPVVVARYIETVAGYAGHIGCYTYDDKGSGFVHVDVRGKNSRGIYTENNISCDYVGSFSPCIKMGSRGRIVKVVQRRLAGGGLYSGSVDGIAGNKTDRGIVAWNAAHGRPDDHVWGPVCWDEAFK